MAATTIYGYDSLKSGTSLTDLTKGRWTSVGSGSNLTLQSGQGRFGGQSLQHFSGGGPNASYIQRSGIGNRATLCLHLPVRFDAASTSTMAAIATFQDGATSQIVLGQNAGGQLEIRRGTDSGAVLGTSSFIPSIGVYYILELKVTFNGSTGIIELRNSGTSIIGPTTGLNTISTANAYANSYVLGQPDSTSSRSLKIQYEHVCCLDDFVGDKRFYTNLATGCPTAVWTPNASTNLSRVQETQEDGDTSYVSSSNPGDIDYYSYPALPTGTKNVFAVITSAWARKDDAGARQVRTKIKQGSTVVNGATVNVSTSYAEQYDIAYVDPVSGIAFVKSDVDSLVTGFEMVA